MKQMFATVLALAFAMLGQAQAQDQAMRYTALVNGGKDKAGHMVITRRGEKYLVDFLFKDNGRGPELKEEYTLAPDGTFATYKVKGATTFGSLVDESFSRKGDQARWKSTSDKGEEAVSGTAIYSPLNGTPQAFSVALTALARSGGKLPMIPSGTLTQRKLLDMDVSRGSEKRRVQLLALTGVGFTPTTVWATTGDAPRLFAYIYPGQLQLIEEGWQSNAADMEAKQVVAEKELLVDFNKRLTHALPGTTLIRNARVFDSEQATLGGPTDVLIEAGRIIEVTPSGAITRKADRVIDAANRVLLPGLFDMHTHVGFWDGGLQVGAGVTTIRDMGNDNPTLLELMKQEEAGTLLMPRVVPAGFIEGESPHASRSGFVVKNLEEAKKAVDWYHSNGFPQIKIYNSFPKDILSETTEYAHTKGMRVSGHIPVHLRAEEAVIAGYDEIQHIN
ncbi:MAG TPA: hypothetical protein VF033_08005, partial [Steroidobacteraceae bacterium]